MMPNNLVKIYILAIHHMNYTSKITKKVLRKKKPKSSPDTELDKAVFLRTKSYIFEKQSNI